MKNPANINQECSEHLLALRACLDNDNVELKLSKTAESGVNLHQTANALAARARSIIERLPCPKNNKEYFKWVFNSVAEYLDAVSDGVFRTQFFQLPSRKQRAYDEMQIRVDELKWFIEQAERVLDGQDPEVER